MTRFTDVTVGLGGVVESRRVHDTADWPAESVALLDAVRPIVRAAEWTGPLEGVLDVPDRLPWLSWRRSGPDATFVCQTGVGLPVTWSVVLSGRGTGDVPLLSTLSALPAGPDRVVEDPPAGAPLLVDMPDRPLLATRMSGYPAEVDLIQACAQVETLLAAGFCRVLRT